MDKKVQIVVAAEDRFGRTFANLKRDLADNQGRLTQFGAALASVNAVAGRLAFGGLAGAAGFVAGVKAMTDGLDALNDAADATGSTVEALSGLEDVAMRNGGNLDLVTTALLKMNKALAEAKPDSPVAKVLSAIGLSAAELRQLDPSEALVRLAKALAQYENDGNKARVVQELLGKSMRELAPLLKDLAESGEISAKVTAQQAEQAEKFNKQLFALQTAATQAGRSLVSDLLPALSEVFTRVQAGKDVFGSLGATLLAGLQAPQFRDAGEGVSYFAKQLKELQDKRAEMLRNPWSLSSLFSLKGVEGDIDKATKFLRFYERVAVAGGNFAGGGRGFVNPPLPGLAKLPDLTDKLGPKAPASEAQKLLESLQKQAEALEAQRRIGSEVVKITVAEQLELDLKAKRIDGITPKLTAQLRAEAKRLDVARQRDQLLEREIGFQKLLADAEQRDVNAGLDLLDATTSGQLEKLERDADRILRISRANPDDASIQRKAGEAMEQLKKRMQDLTQEPEQVKTEFDKMADAIEKSMERSTGALLDFIVELKGTPEDLAKAFARDVLRGLIEDPIRDTVKGLTSTLREQLKAGLSGGGGLFGGGSLASLLSQAGSGGGWSGWNFDLSALLGAFSGRALGGNVRAGQLVRWQENGREWFVPGQDGTVLTQSQARGAGGQQVNYMPTIHVNGDVSAQTVAMLRNMVAADRAQFMRQLRTGAVGV